MIVFLALLVIAILYIRSAIKHERDYHKPNEVSTCECRELGF